MSRVYSWRPDVPDRRDYLYAPALPPTLPTHIDLREQQSPVEDQQALGSCVGQAWVGLLESLEIRAGRMPALYIAHWER